MQVAVNHASFMHGDAQACHFDGIVRLLCVNEHLRQHVKVENNSTTLAARQAAIAAATALAECGPSPLRPYRLPLPSTRFPSYVPIIAMFLRTGLIL